MNERLSGLDAILMFHAIDRLEPGKRLFIDRPSMRAMCETEMSSLLLGGATNSEVNAYAEKLAASRNLKMQYDFESGRGWFVSQMDCYAELG